MSDQERNLIEGKLTTLLGLFHALDKKVGIMNEHSKNQNGKVADNQEDIVVLQDQVGGLRMVIIKYTSAGAAAVTVISIGAKYLFGI